jgi:peptidoglycan biosynthesis protein MviN/MurJ (putative lipid II flippase)
VARTVLVSVLTLLSRLLGFAREALMAAVFGERSVISDAFITAWRFPNLFRRLLGEGALSTSLQAEMTKADIERGDAAGRALFLATLRLMSSILLGITVLCMVVMAFLPDAMPITGWAWLGRIPKPCAISPCASCPTSCSCAWPRSAAERWRCAGTSRCRTSRPPR